MMSMSSTPSSSKVSKNRDESNSMALTHPLTTDDISEPTEEKLSNQGTNGGRNLDTEVLVGGKLLVLGVKVRKRKEARER